MGESPVIFVGLLSRPSPLLSLSLFLSSLFSTLLSFLPQIFKTFSTLYSGFSYKMASALLRSRVKRPSYLTKLAKAEDLIDLFPNGSYIGWSGFTGVGYPKYVPLLVAFV